MGGTIDECENDCDHCLDWAAGSWNRRGDFSSPTAANSRSRHQPTYSRKKKRKRLWKALLKRKKSRGSPHRKQKQQQLAEEFAKEKEEYYLLLANAEKPAAAGLEHPD